MENRLRFGRLLSVGTALWVMFAWVVVGTAARADEGLKSIDNPGGGQVVYGPVEGQTTMQGAMGFMLRKVHGHFGDRPEIGKFFQGRGGDSVATFFTLTAKNQGGKKMSGLVIVSMPKGARPAAAVLYDEAARFGKTEPVLMKKLNEAWQAGSVRPAGATAAGAVTGQAATGHAAAVPPLQRASVADGSGSIGLPAGWKITGGGGGSLHAAGPGGETVNVGVMIQQIYDPNNPRSRQMIQYMQMAHKPVFVCPSGGDLMAAYMCVAKQNHERQNLPVPTFQLTSEQKLPGNQFEAPAGWVVGELDMHDGKGPQVMHARLGATRPGQDGAWVLTINASNVPDALAAEEPTISAIVASFRQNGQVIQQETNQVIDQIHANAKAAQIRADATSAANDAHNAAVEQQWDTNAKYNKSFENYQLDRTVIQDNAYSERGTTGYALGDALVKSDPNRFQYVPTQDFLKGIDY